MAQSCSEVLSTRGLSQPLESVDSSFFLTAQFGGNVFHCPENVHTSITNGCVAVGVGVERNELDEVYVDVEENKDREESGDNADMDASNTTLIHADKVFVKMRNSDSGAPRLLHRISHPAKMPTSTTPAASSCMVPSDEGVAYGNAVFDEDLSVVVEFEEQTENMNDVVKAHEDEGSGNAVNVFDDMFDSTDVASSRSFALPPPQYYDNFVEVQAAQSKKHLRPRRMNWKKRKMKVLEFPTTLCRSILAEFSYVKKASGGGSKEVRKLRLCMDFLSTQDKLLRDKHKMFDKIHYPKAKAKFGVKMKTFKGLVSKGVVNRWFTISKGATVLEYAIEGMVLPTMLLYVLEKGAITMNGFKGPSSCNEVFDVAIKSYKDKYKDGKMFESFTFNGAWGTYSALAMVKQGGMNYSHVLKGGSDIAEFVLGSLVDDEVEVFGKPCMKIRDTEVVEVSIMVEIPWDRKKRKKKVGLVCVVFGIPISLTCIDFGNKRKIGWGLKVSSGFDILSSGDEEHVTDSTIPSVDDEKHVADGTLILVVEVKVTSINESVNEGELNKSMGSQLASCGGVGNELSEFSVGVKTGCVNNKKVKGEFVKQAIQWVDGNQLAAAEGCEEISVKNYEIDINVDLHNRQIVVYLRETTMRLFSSNVLSSGMHGLSNEIAKDLILDGVKFVTWYVERTIEVWDFSSYFIFTEDDGGKYRAPASVQKLQELNNDVGVHSLTVPDAEVAVALGSSVPLNTLTALVSDMCFEFNDDARTNKNPSTNQSSKETTKPPKFLKNVDAGIVKILPSKPMIVENFCEYNPLDYFDAMDMHEVAANGTIKSDDVNVSKFHLVDTKNSTCGSIEKWIVSRGSVTWTIFQSVSLIQYVILKFPVLVMKLEDKLVLKGTVL